VFGGIAAYQPLIKDAPQDIEPTYLALSSLGTYSMLEWIAPLFGPGELPEKPVAIGQTWRLTMDGFGKELLTVAKVDGSTATVRRADTEPLPVEGDPLRTPTIYVWDVARGRLVRHESSFNPALEKPPMDGG